MISIANTVTKVIFYGGGSGVDNLMGVSMSDRLCHNKGSPIFPTGGIQRDLGGSVLIGCP